MNPGKAKNDLWMLLRSFAPNQTTREAFEREDAVEIKGHFNKINNNVITERRQICGAAYFVDFFGGSANDINDLYLESGGIQHI